MENTCSNCGHPIGPIPTEPKLGTWVRDKYGAISVRIIDSDKRDGWAPAPTGFYAGGQWEAMWHARGPLVECNEWGRNG